MLPRNFREQDLIDCLEIQPGRIGLESVGRSEALRIWKELTRSRSFNSVVIEADPRAQGHRIVGFGASLFVSPAFARDEVSNPRPGLNSRIISSIACGRSVVLKEPELRSANTAGDLDLVILYSGFRTGVLSPEEFVKGYTIMSTRFLELHLGYRISRLLNEVLDETEKYHNEQTHAWRVLSNFDEFWAMQPDAPWERSRALMVIERDALSVNGSVINILFHPRKPRLRLRDADQQLLTAALDGLTDEDLANQLELSLPAIKKRWLSLFERTQELLPDLVPKLTGDNLPKRGKQKRYHLLAYVRAHPEELRPTESEPRLSQ